MFYEVKMTTTLRIPDPVAERAKQQAINMGTSFNDFIVAAVIRCLDEQKEAEWRAGFEAMAQDPEANDVEYAIAAQAEVVLG